MQLLCGCNEDFGTVVSVEILYYIKQCAANQPP